VAPAVEGFKDLSLRETWVIAPIMVVIVGLGIYPKPLLDIINPAVQSTNAVVRTHDPSPSVPELSPTNGGTLGLVLLPCSAASTCGSGK
jgi:hypothetical protein